MARVVLVGVSASGRRRVGSLVEVALERRVSWGARRRER